MREAITVQVGQSENQVGTEFWNGLCAEHGIQPDGRFEKLARDGGGDKMEPFLYQANDNQNIPRAWLINLEPHVIPIIQLSRYHTLYNPQKTFVVPQGGDAGNSWEFDYRQSTGKE